jgi:hypothetical protein
LRHFSDDLALVSACVTLAWASSVGAVYSSYATLATDVVGVTGASSVAIGVPDYQFVNDLGLGFGGTSIDVFEIGESAVLSFPSPLRNIASQHDLILYAFVGGLGATDNANVQVEASTDGVNFAVIATFDTSEARSRSQDLFENDFEAVKHFFIEFGALDGVTDIRLTNLGGTSEGLRLDALEGLHPDVAGTHAFELRIERSRLDEWQQFKLRVKNIADPGGVPIREIRINNSTIPFATIEETSLSIEGSSGDFICVENCRENCTVNCTPMNLPSVPFVRYAWSLDGDVEAPAGVGLEPGQQAAHHPSFGIDTDSSDPYLSGYSFEITFADGVVHFIDYDVDVEKEIGSLYEKHLYFSSSPVLSWNRPVDFYELVSSGPPPAVPALSAPAVGLLVSLVLAGGVLLIRGRDPLDPATRSGPGRG